MPGTGKKKSIKFSVDNLQSFFSKENINLYKEKLQEVFSKENIQIFLEKIKSFRKEDIILRYYTHKDFILRIIYSLLLGASLIVLLILSVRIYTVYKKLENKVTELSIVQNHEIINFIKSNNLRVLDGFIDTVYILKYQTYNNQKYSKFYKYLLIQIVKLLKSQPGIIDALCNDLKMSNPGITLEQKINSIISFINKSNIKTLSNTFNKSLLIRKFLSSFPSDIKLSKIKMLFKDSKLAELIAKTLPNLYVYELPAIKHYVEVNGKEYKVKYENNVAPYNKFLTYIFLPSFNIWVNKFSEVINPDIFGKNYLSKAEYIDLNIIKYWNKFFLYSYKGKLYQGEKNIINSIKLGKINILPDKNLASVGLNIDFSLNSEASFYGLISKLTLTSNVKNIMLLNEFTFYLWNQIKNYIGKVLPKNFETSLPLGTRWIVYQYYICVKENSLDCLKLFGCKTNTCLSSDIKEAVGDLDKLIKNVDIVGLYGNLKKLLVNNSNYDFKNSSFAKFIKNEYYKINDINKLIGARLYDCIKGNGYCGDIFDKNYSQISNAIKLFAGCDINTNLYSDMGCKYNFINKFDTNYFVGYTMVDRLGQIDYSLLDRLKDVYNNIPAVLQLGKYVFSKPENTDALADYIAKIGINIFYKYISQDDYNKILSYIGKSYCKLVTNGSSFDLGKAYNYVSQRYLDLSQADTDATTLYELRQLKNLIQDFQKQSQKQTLLEKLLANLEVYRIFKNRGYCQ